MEFGKISDLRQLDRIDFKLPSLDSRGLGLSGLKKPRPALKFFVGGTVWSKKEWVGKIYPPHAQSQSYLRHYAKEFNTIELNTTFYKIPDIQTVQKWKKDVPPGFKFCPKLFQGISRFQVLSEVPELTSRFIDSILHFEENLGTCFLQLPPHFDASYFLVLKRFLKLLPKGFQLAVEFRSPTWFLGQQLIDPCYELLVEQGISAVITDVAGRRDVSHASLPTPSPLVRFVGNALHPSDWTRLDQWVKRILEWDSLQELYFFVHQPEDEGTPEWIDRFIEKINEACGLTLQTWDPEIGQPQRDLFI